MEKINDKQPLINDNISDNDDDDIDNNKTDNRIGQAIENIVSTAVMRLSDESENENNHHHHHQQQPNIDTYIANDTIDSDDDGSNDENQLLIKSPKNRKSPGKSNKLINSSKQPLVERHHLQQPKLQQKQQQQQQQHTKLQMENQQRRLQLPPNQHKDHHHQHSRHHHNQKDDASHCIENNFIAKNLNNANIINENTMGITPQIITQPSLDDNLNNNNHHDNGDGTFEDNNNNEQNDEPSSSSSSEKFNWYIYLVTILSAIGGFLFGYDTGIVSGAMVYIRDYFHLSTSMQEIVVSVTILTAWIFSFIAGYLTNRFGRKITIIIASFVFTVGGFMMAFAHTEYVLLTGRAIVGLAIGLASMAIPVYIAEVAPSNIRGKLVSTNVCFITFGQFIASIVAGLFSHDQHNGWRWMLGLASVPSILQMLFFVFLPESPRWLVQKQRYQEALDSLRKFRNASADDTKVLREFNSIKQSFIANEQERKNAKSIRQIISNRTIMKSLFVGSMLMIFQQVAGINTVMYYSATIIQMSGINDKAQAVWLSALTASINFIFSFVGLILVERIGRRILILSSLCGVVLSLFMLAAGFQLAKFHSPSITFHDKNFNDPCSSLRNCDACISSEMCGYCFYTSEDVVKGLSSSMLDSLSMSNVNGTCLPMDTSTKLPFSNSSYCVDNNSTSNMRPMQWATDWCPSEYSWMTLAGLMLYLFFFAPGMGPMPWTINSEIYPLWARSFCYSVSTSFNWFFNLLVSLTFLTLTNLLTIHGAFYLYAGLALFGLIMFFFILPETKGKKLEEIEHLFEGSLFRIGFLGSSNHNSDNNNNDNDNDNDTNQRNNLSQFNQNDSTFNASRSTVLTNASNDSNIGNGHVKLGIGNVDVKSEKN